MGDKMDEMQVVILQAAVLGGALAEVTQIDGPLSEDDPLDAIVQAGHEALCQLQGNPEALEDLNEAAPRVLDNFAIGEGNVYAGALVQELLA